MGMVKWIELGIITFRYLDVALSVMTPNICWIIELLNEQICLTFFMGLIGE